MKKRNKIIEIVSIAIFSLTGGILAYAQTVAPPPPATPTTPKDNLILRGNSNRTYQVTIHGENGDRSYTTTLAEKSPDVMYGIPSDAQKIEITIESK